MAENSLIEWTDHRFSSGRLVRRPQLQAIGMNKPMATLTKSDAVSNVKTQIGMLRETADVVGIQVPASIVAAVAASKSVSKVNIVAPTLQLRCRAKTPPFRTFPVNVAGSVCPAQRVGSGCGADLGARLGRVPLSFHGAGATFRGGAHLRATLVRHPLALHRGNEGRLPLHPCFTDNFAAGQGSFSHG